MNQERAINEFISKEEFNKIYNFAKDKETPFLIINTTKVLNKYEEIRKNLPLQIYFML